MKHDKPIQHTLVMNLPGGRMLRLWRFRRVDAVAYGPLSRRPFALLTIESWEAELLFWQRNGRLRRVSQSYRVRRSKLQRIVESFQREVA